MNMNSTLLNIVMQFIWHYCSETWKKNALVEKIRLDKINIEYLVKQNIFLRSKPAVNDKKYATEEYGKYL